MLLSSAVISSRSCGASQRILPQCQRFIIPKLHKGSIISEVSYSDPSRVPEPKIHDEGSILTSLTAAKLVSDSVFSNTNKNPAMPGGKRRADNTLDSQLDSTSSEHSELSSKLTHPSINHPVVTRQGKKILITKRKTPRKQIPILKIAYCLFSAQSHTWPLPLPPWRPRRPQILPFQTDSQFLPRLHVQTFLQRPLITQKRKCLRP